MIRIVLVLVVLVAIAVLVVLAVQALRRRGGQWEVTERSDGDAVLVMAARPGQRAMLVERVPLAGEDFELRVEEARAMARAKVVALNNG